MKNFKKKRITLIGIIFISIWILGLLQNSNVSYAQPQYSNETISVSSRFSMLEFSEDEHIKENDYSVNITLPSSTWNVTDLKINFTSIKMGLEVIKVETEHSEDEAVLDKGITQYAVQINLTRPTKIFAVEIFGQTIIEAENNLFAEIRGYGDGGDPNAPNITTYGSTVLNISYRQDWYVQTFSNPIDLPSGYYYLVINGSSINVNEKAKYYWYYNESSTRNPNLRTYVYDSGWAPLSIGDPLLYKIHQRVNESYNPSEINMTVEFEGNPYEVLDGTNPYSGDLAIPVNNYSPGIDYLNLPIKNNRSIELLVNYSYHIKQKNLLSSDGSILIREGLMNFWSVTPDFNRTDGNYSIQFDYPSNWIWPGVFKNGINETIDPNIIIDTIEKKIYLLNDTITPITNWNITAWSQNIDFSLDIPTTSYGPSQTMRITVTPPSIIGNFTFFLVDPFGDEEFSNTTENPIGDYEFEYTYSSNPFSGQWNAYILWNNQTDAGIQVLSLQVNIVAANGGGGGGGSKTVVTGIDPQLIFMVILYVAIASIAGLTSYKMVKRHKRNKAEHREQVFNKYMDLLNLDYIMIIDKKSGLSVYDQILAGKERDSSLISGFLEAIRTFGIDLTGSEEESQTISLQYQNMNIIMNDFKNFRILNIMKESPSQDFLDSLRPLSHDIDTFYGKSLKDFDGNVTKFRGVKDLLETHLYTSLIYPLKVIKSKEVKLDSAEKSLMNKAQSMMKKNKTEHFYVSHLMGASKEFNVKNAEIILKLIDKKVFRPIE